MSRSRRGLFVDLDGTLADTMNACRVAYEQFLSHFGATGSATEFDSLNGPPLREVVSRLRAARALPGSDDELLSLYESQLRDAHLSALPADGAGELLDTARQYGYCVAIVTSAPRDFAATWLARANLASMIEFVVSGDDVRHGKPDPEPYCRALAAARCLAAESLAVEDSVPGVTAALAADLPTFMIGGAPTGGIRAHAGFRGGVASLRDVTRQL
jgi:HAD superfamily hydrolase (TIGR01509 family)